MLLPMYYCAKSSYPNRTLQMGKVGNCNKPSKKRGITKPRGVSYTKIKCKGNIIRRTEYCGGTREPSSQKQYGFTESF